MENYLLFKQLLYDKKIILLYQKINLNGYFLKVVTTLGKEKYFIPYNPLRYLECE